MALAVVATVALQATAAHLTLTAGPVIMEVARLGEQDRAIRCLRASETMTAVIPLAATEVTAVPMMLIAALLAMAAGQQGEQDLATRCLRAMEIMTILQAARRVSKLLQGSHRSHNADERLLADSTMGKLMEKAGDMFGNDRK